MPKKIIVPNAESNKSEIILDASDIIFPEGYKQYWLNSNQWTLIDSHGRINISYMYNWAKTQDPKITDKKPVTWLVNKSTKELRANYQNLLGFDPVNTVKGGDRVSKSDQSENSHFGQRVGGNDQIQNSGSGQRVSDNYQSTNSSFGNRVTNDNQSWNSNSGVPVSKDYQTAYMQSDITVKVNTQRTYMSSGYLANKNYQTPYMEFDNLVSSNSQTPNSESENLAYSNPIS